MQKLFSHEKFKGCLIFKGGTCLSKAYNAIARLSKDVDITIKPEFLGDLEKSTKINEIKSINHQAVRKFVENEICPFLKEEFDNEIGSGEYKLIFDEEDIYNVTLFFEFPLINSPFPLYAIPFFPTDDYSYIKPKIKLEFGGLGGVLPLEKKLIKPYAKEIMDGYFDEFEVNTLSIKRNFIEKLLILHSVAYRPDTKSIAQNYSRHYYDVYSIIKSNVVMVNCEESLEILRLAVENTRDFWKNSWVKYEDIKSFSDIKLIPNNARIEEIKRDYKDMEDMFFKYYPKCNEMMSFLQEF